MMKTGGERIQRWNMVERIEHHIIMMVIPGFIFTGLPIFIPEVFSWMVAGPINIELMRIAHRVLIGLTAGLAVFHVLYHSIALRGHSRMWIAKSDIADAKGLMMYYMGRADKKPELDFHNPTEKLLVYWGMSVLALLIMGISGFILMFRDAFPVWIQMPALIVHDIFFIIITAILMIHFYMSVLYPEHRPLLDGMFTDGTVPADYVKEHHYLWYRSTAAEKEKA
jgi:formate dehydrogenase subunit gamma